MSLIFYHFTLSDGRTICGSPVELEGAHVGRSHSEKSASWGGSRL